MPRPLRSGPLLLLLALAPMAVHLGCGSSGGETPAPVGTFTLSVSPASLQLTPGASKTLQIQRITSDGFSGGVSVTFQGLPQGLTLSPSTLVLSDGQARTVTATAGADIQELDAQITCTGTGGGQSATKAFQVSLRAGTFTLNLSPASIQLSPGASRTFQIQRVPADGFNQAVAVTFSGIPEGVTLSPAAPTLTTNDPVTITATAGADIQASTSTLSCTGTWGSITDTKSLQVSLGIGTFALLASPTALQLDRGASAQFQIQRLSSGGFNKPVAVTFSGLPQGVTLSPASPTLSTADPVTITATAAADAVSLNTSFQCTGTYNGMTDTKDLQILWSLPVLTITTTGGAPIDSKELYVPAHLSLDPGGPYALEADGEMRIRGNSTAEMPKKPYKVKLPKKSPAPFFGFPAHRDWALLANYSDKTLMRNAVAMELSRRLGLPWTPRSAHTEVYLNGSYDGTYLMMESVKVDPNRVNIPAMTSADIAGDALTGGYLLEMDERFEQEWLWPGNQRTAHGVAMGLQDPEVPTAEQQTYIVDYIQQAEDAIYAADSSNAYENFLDVDSFINWYLLNELFANVDSYGFGSCWLYKPRGGKLFMGPAWDFDLGAGNVDYADCEFPTGWWLRRNSLWYSQLFQNAAFAQRVKARWNAVKATQIDTIFAYIDQNALILDRAQKRNFVRWPILDVYVWPNHDVFGSYAGEVGYLKSWLTQRVAWMDAQYNP